MSTGGADGGSTSSSAAQLMDALCSCCTRIVTWASGLTQASEHHSNVLCLLQINLAF